MRSRFALRSCALFAALALCTGQADPIYAKSSLDRVYSRAPSKLGA
jgi:hypothetical protein